VVGGEFTGIILSYVEKERCKIVDVVAFSSPWEPDEEMWELMTKKAFQMPIIELVACTTVPVP
jgi:hypothetical protein